MTKTGLLLLSAITIISACKKPKDEDKSQPMIPQIEISARSQVFFSSGISFSHESSSQTLEFTTSDSWSTVIADSQASGWLSVKPSSGKAGTVTMTVSAKPNDGFDERSSVVTIKCDTVNKDFTVRQAGQPVISVTGITLDKSSISLIEGEEAIIEATVKPDDATDKTVTWNSSDESVAMVDGGKVKALSAGTAVITAMAGSISAICKVVVNRIVPVTDISISPSTLNLDRNTSAMLTAIVCPSDATEKSVIWESLSPAVASVDQTGMVTTLAKGTAIIKARIGAVEGDCTVTVFVSVLSVTLNKNSLLLGKGSTETLIATVNPVDADDNKVIWTSSNPSVATVGENGMVTAIAEGEARITASAGGKSDVCDVTVGNSMGDSEDYEGGNGQWDNP